MVAEQLPSTKIPTSQRREELLKIITDLGLWNMSYSQLGTMFGVSHQQIAKDVKIILDAWKPESMDRVGKIVELAYQKGIKENMKLLNDADKKLRLKAISTLAVICGSYQSYLESTGRTPKIAEKLQVTGQVVHIDAATALHALFDEPTTK